VPENLFSGLSNLQVINLRDNDLSCKPAVPSHINLYLNDYNLPICPNSKSPLPPLPSFPDYSVPWPEW